VGITNNALIKQLFAAYPYAQVSDQTVVVYIRGLSNIPSDDLDVVIQQCIAEKKYLPTVAEIQDMYRSLSGSLAQLSSGEAWGEVHRAIARYGHIRKPQFDDDIIIRTVEAMGWNNLCMSENQAADRARFMQIYADISKRKESVDRLTPKSRKMLESKAGGMKSLSTLLSNTKYLTGGNDEDAG